MQPGQVAVKYRRNVCSLSIDMSADNRTTILSRHIDQHIGRVSVEISIDTLVDMSTDISGLEIATNMVANVTNFFSLATKIFV